MFVCHCRVVTDGQIREAIACGARDLCSLAAACGAGRTCGGCIPALVRLLQEQGHDDVPRTAGDIRAELRERGSDVGPPARLAS